MALALLGIVFYFHYHDSFFLPFLSHLLITLIAGQFYHYWSKRHEKEKVQSAFLKEKLEDLSDAFYTLKISHDSLENSYALQPHSLRSSINQLQELFFKDGSHYENFLQIIAKRYQVEASLLALVSNGIFHTASSIEKGKKLHLSDPLVQKALQTQQMSYISGELDEQKSLYLAVIPLQNKEDKTNALLVIEKMPFMAFNQNNLISMAILFSYFLKKEKLWAHLQSLGEETLTQEAIFNYHFNSMKSLNEEYNMPSSILVFKPKDTLMYQKLADSTKQNLRALDHYRDINDLSTKSIMILLPLTSKSATESVINKILLSAHLSLNDVPHMVFDIKQENLLSAYLKEK